MNYKKINFIYRTKVTTMFPPGLLAGLIFILMMNYSALLCASDRQAKEYFLKTAFLYNFARLVEWPKTTFKTPSVPIRLCFIGRDNFADALTAIENKKAHSRPLIIKRDITLSDIPHCQILFISPSEEDRLSDVLKVSAQYPVLTVSELDDFAEKKGHIRFFIKGNNTLSLEINLEAAKQSDLKISSRILSIAKIVKSEQGFRP